MTPAVVDTTAPMDRTAADAVMPAEARAGPQMAMAPAPSAVEAMGLLDQPAGRFDKCIRGAGQRHCRAGGYAEQECAERQGNRGGE